MTSVASLAAVAALIGHPARAAMIMTLMDGRALTAGELAQAAGVTPPTASSHLARLLDGGLLALVPQGRHRYYRLASTSVADLVERMMSASSEFAAQRRPVSTGPAQAALRHARTCYDHLAGAVAVSMFDSMVASGCLIVGADGSGLSERGRTFLADLGVALDRVPANQRRAHAFCRPCLDWSERRPHLGGKVGRSMFEHFLERGWLRRARNSRSVAVTPIGVEEIGRRFDLPLAALSPRSGGNKS